MAFFGVTSGKLGELFDFFLKVEAGKVLERFFYLVLVGEVFQEVGEVLGFDMDDHAGVGEGGVAAGEGHAVDDDFVVFRGGGDDEAAGAHAKGVNATVLDLGGEAVAGGGEDVRAFLFRMEVVLGAVDEGLRVFDADSDGEGFFFETDFFAVKEEVDVAGGVAGGEDDGAAGEFFSIGGGDAVEATVFA